MFDEKTKAAWQGIGPDPALRQRVLNQTAPAQPKTIPFPLQKTVRALTTAAAWIVVAVLLLNPAPQVNFVGQGPGVAAASFSRQAQHPVTILLTYDGESSLEVSEGTLEVQGRDLLWHLPGEGEYILTATRGRRTTVTHFQVLTEDGVSVSLTTH